jgi:hypothetical protein
VVKARPARIAVPMDATTQRSTDGSKADRRRTRGAMARASRPAMTYSLVFLNAVSPCPSTKQSGNLPTNIVSSSAAVPAAYTASIGTGRRRRARYRGAISREHASR